MRSHGALQSVPLQQLRQDRRRLRKDQEDYQGELSWLLIHSHHGLGRPPFQVVTGKVPLVKFYLVLSSGQTRLKRHIKGCVIFTQAKMR